ncbi:MAG: DUF4390 domain-containing protein [Acidobacteriota bacterium]
MKVRAATLAAFCGLSLAVLWLGVGVHADAEARLENLEVRLEGQKLLVSTRLSGAFTEDFRERLQSGLPTPLVYRFVLERQRRTWFDASEARSRLQVVAMFNAVTSEYLINYKHDGELVQSRVVRDQQELERAMTQLDAFPIFIHGGRGKDDGYYVRASADLGTRTILAFIPRTLSTDWVRTTPLRLGGEP